jgi:hypothetical protein
MKKILVAILVFWGLQASAQLKGITGRITDSTGEKGLDKATVKLVEKNLPKDTLRSTTNSNGEFSFDKVPSSVYSIIVSYSGYKPMVKEFFKPSEGVAFIDLGDFVLLNDYRSLSEIVVEAPAVTIKEDTVEYRASAFQTKPNASTEDLLKKLPGVQVDRNGNVTAQGKQVTRVKVNGKDFFTGDPKTATREIPADMIDKVQVVDDYGDQSAMSGIRDGEPEKVINLQLKKEKNKGVFGRAQASVGTNERYQAGINLNYFNNKKQLSVIGNSNNVNQSSFSGGDLSGFGGGNFGGGAQGGGNRGGMSFTIGGPGGGGFGGGNNNGQNQDGITRTNSIGTNYRSDFGKRNSFYGSYTYTDRLTNLEQFQSQFNVLNNSDFITNQTSLNRQGTHRAFANLELWIDSFNYLKISPNISVQNTNNKLGNTLDIFNSGKTQISGGGNRDTTVSERPSMRTSVLYNHRFKRRGRNLSINTDIGWSETDQDQSRLNIIQPFFNGTALTVQNTLQRITQDNKGFNINSRIVYSEPLSKERLLDLSYNFNHNFTSSDRKTFQKDFNTGQFDFLGTLSNAFENDFNFNRFGATLRTIKQKYNYSVGVLLQPVTLRGFNVTKDTALQTVTNFNWFPVARFTYNFSRTKSFNFSYNGSAQQPSLNQLQPVLDSSNRQFQTEGNPNLKPSVNHTINFNYNNFNFSKGTVFFTNLALSTIRDLIVNNNIAIPFGQRTKPENVDGFYNANLFYTYSKPWKNRKYVLNLNGTVNFTNSPVLLNSVEGKSENWLVMQGFDFTFNAKEWLELSAGARYNLNKAEFSQNPAQNLNQTSWTLSNDVRIDFPKGWIMRWEFDYTINRGLAEGVTRNIALLNGSLEKELFKKKNATLRLQAFDIFNQNININRSVNANFITDTRVNRLAQYFMVGFVYRLNRFNGQGAQNNIRRPGRGELFMNN